MGLESKPKKSSHPHYHHDYLNLYGLWRSTKWKRILQQAVPCMNSEKGYDRYMCM